MTRALIVKADGDYRVEDIEPDLITIKGLLDGGWLEAINGDEPGWHAYLDEDGKMKQLPVNHRAMDLAAALGWHGALMGDFLVGPVVFLGDNPPGEGDVPDFVLATLKNL